MRFGPATDLWAERSAEPSREKGPARRSRRRNTVSAVTKTHHIRTSSRTHASDDIISSFFLLFVSILFYRYHLRLASLVRLYILRSVSGAAFDWSDTPTLTGRGGGKCENNAPRRQAKRYRQCLCESEWQIPARGETRERNVSINTQLLRSAETTVP